jgi:hypothetical protein
MAAQVTVPAYADTRFAAGMSAVEKINAKGLERHLRRHVQGEVRLDAGHWRCTPTTRPTSGRFRSG